MSNRFFVEGRHESGQAVPLSGSDAHKIISVLRMRQGDTIEIIDSAAQRFRATLAIDERSVRAELGERIGSPASVLPHVTVAQGVPKGQKMDFVVEKLTELGAAEIIPLQSERTIVNGVSENKIERWRRLAKTAAQQCGRDDIPRIADPLALADLCKTFAAYDVVLFPWELADRVPLRDLLPELVADARRILVLVGPEGGFSHAEAAAAHSAGAQLISLGSRILRTETAALAVLAVLNYLTETQRARV
ncbi:MAG TPA: 16S rRNA (uracil(1498)-N(3))-methyltransferase [Candidatus Baltobacteraceae bacterium]|nr:16S rRNA (uracil(1498)-N(3))-methyltransferase [Candidatus Baltobacteraceae bacterium]